MSFGIYIHWPFCLSKCPYCDFNSHVAESIDHTRWKNAYLKELEYWASLTPGLRVESVFFGGGTPSLMAPDTVAEILASIQSHWSVANDWEVTLEANPTSVEIEKFRDFRGAGVSRVSLGVQSLRDDALKFLGRAHDAAQARAAIEIARNTFDRFSFDLIYARPGQTVLDWKEELGAALGIAGNHLSLYQLTIEKGTPFHLRHDRGEFHIPPQDEAADLYDLTQEMTAAAGLPAYEVSNHARLGEESRHNLLYWRYGDYAGIGPGAHGRLTRADGSKIATRGHRAPDVWLKKVEDGENGLHPAEDVSREERLREALMMGLRITEGVPLSLLAAEYGGDPFEVIDQRRVEVLVEEGLLESFPPPLSSPAEGGGEKEETLRTTPQGRKCLNAVLAYLWSRNG